MRALPVALIAVAVISRGVPVVAAKPQPCASKVTAVTVFADRARVTRSAAVALPAGTRQLVLSELPGWIDEASVRVGLQPATAARILDVRTSRTYLTEATDVDVRNAEKALAEITDELGGLDDEVKVLDAQAEQISAIRAFSLEKIPRDMVVREIPVASYGEIVSYIGKALREVASARREVAVKRRELEPELKVRQRRLEELRRLRQLEQSTITVEVAAQAPADARLEVTYMLPGATWEAAHELRAMGSSPKEISLISYAVVSQTTGEDWEGASLAFATQSSAASIRIPHLEALHLGNRQAVLQLAGVQTESFTRAQQAYKEQNGLWFNVRNPKEDVQVFAANTAQQSLVQARTVRVFEQLRQRGTTALFAGRGTPTVRSDGRPIRVMIGELTLPAERRIVAVPQVSLNAARTLRLQNAGEQPLLPGKVSLYNDAAFLGLTDLDFVAEGEVFSVFLGVADQLKLSRILDRQHSSLVRGRRTRMQIAFEITVENLSDDTVKLELSDRIPVSQHKEIEVSHVRVKPRTDADSQGLLRWPLTLVPKAREAVRIEYTIEYPPEMIARLKQSHSSMAAPSQSRDLSFEIERLESKF